MEDFYFMAKKIERQVSELPRNFNLAKKEFEKCKNIFLASKRKTWKETLEDGVKQVTHEKINIEDKALLFMLVDEFEKFLFEQDKEICENLKIAMDEENNYRVILGEYGKVVRFDEESCWFYCDDMSEKDWKDYDKKCNEEYLNKKKNSLI